jgi:hypothetical protein
MKRLKTKKGIALLLTLVVVGASAFGAYAYWTQGGTGTGQATTGTTTGITVNQTSVSAATLYPGGPFEALSGNFDNPNPNAVTISGITAVVSSVTGGAADPLKPTCDPSDYTIGGTSGANTVPVGTGVGSWTGLTISLNDNEPNTVPANNQDNCKNAVAHITYTAAA